MEVSAWIRTQLFPEDFLVPDAFPASVSLLRRPDFRPYLETLLHGESERAPFSRLELYQALMKSCGVLGLERAATWFQVNVHDNCVAELERWGEYPYPLGEIGPPLQWLYRMLEDHPAMEGGTSYAGLLGRNRDWLFVIELECELCFTLFGPQALCDAVRRELRLLDGDDL